MPQVFSALFTLKRFTNFSIIITIFQIPFDIIVCKTLNVATIFFTVKFWQPHFYRKCQIFKFFFTVWFKSNWKKSDIYGKSVVART